jgi:hypothetical protein
MSFEACFNHGFASNWQTGVVLEKMQDLCTWRAAAALGMTRGAGRDKHNQHLPKEKFRPHCPVPI